jgi:replicative superfamily II helicase
MIAPHRFATTTDLVRKRKQPPVTVSGVKRKHGDIAAPVASLLGGAGPLNEMSGNPRYEFKRPSLQAPPNSKHLKASVIETVGGPPPTGFISGAQRNIISSTPTATQDPYLSLKHPVYALPDSLVHNLISLGIRSIYPWQSRCLLGRGLMTGEKNLVYTAPTGGGKSLVADVLMLKRVIENKKAILVLPYVALVQEKLSWLRRAVEGVRKKTDPSSQADLQHSPKFRKCDDHRSIRVVGFFGGSKARATWADVDIAVCTIEKANALVNTAIEAGTVNELGIVVMDELHMIDDDHRGYLMELMATKLLSMQQGVQIVGMSATLSNTEILATWLDAKYYQSMYKPIPVGEYLVYDNTVHSLPAASDFTGPRGQPAFTPSKSSKPAHRIIRPSEHIEMKRPIANAVVALTIETVLSGYAALVFCGSRSACQATAGLIARAMQPVAVLDEQTSNRRKDVLNSLRSLPVGLDEVLEQTIPQGVAFHHAGLTTEERDLIAEAFDAGVLKVIVATCSLAAGINLPARRVILQGARMGRDFVGPAMLRQMRGRAGRKGKDDLGESYICCQREDLEEIEQLLEADIPPIQSCLTPGKRGIKRALLEVIAVRLAAHPDALHEYIRRTLLYHTIDRSLLDTMVQKALEDLLESGFISLGSEGTYGATLLGQAVVASSLTPDDGLFVHAEFQRAMQAFVMDGEMHIFYMFTPVHSTGLGDIHWPIFRREIDGLDESGLRVLQFCGISPAFVNRMANSGKQLPEGSQKEEDTARIYRRFYAALQLRDLCNEVPVHLVARKYDMPRGSVQNLAQTCEGFAAGMIKFCERMGWGMLRSVLEHMCDRLKAGAKADLLELAQIPFVKSRMARVFWESGLKSVRAVAAAEAKDVVEILLLAQPKRSKINGDEEERYRGKLMGKAEVIVGAANRLWERQQLVDIEEDV